MRGWTDMTMSARVGVEEDGRATHSLNALKQKN